MVRARTKRQAGGILLILVGVLMIIALAVFARQSMAMIEAKFNRTVLGASNLEAIDTALVNFVMVNQRLPCPAATNSGVERFRGNTCDLTTGQVPWISLGLAEHQASDKAHVRIGYRVQAELANPQLRLMNMSWCSPTGGVSNAVGATQACTPNCTGSACMQPVNFLYAKGLQVKDSNNVIVNEPSPIRPPASPPPMSNGAAYELTALGQTSHPTISAVLEKAKLGPRAH